VKAIRALGELLAAQGDAAGIIVVGGAAMILGGIATRLREDVDIIAVASGVWDEEVGALSTLVAQMFYPPSQTQLAALSSPPSGRSRGTSTGSGASPVFSGQRGPAPHRPQLRSIAEARFLYVVATTSRIEA
jgi:hypothetical protein